MVYVSTCISYDESNSFNLREIYIGGEKTTYILQKSDGYLPREVPVNFFSLINSADDLILSDFGHGNIRKINDRDEKSLANFIKSKIDRADLGNPLAEKALFDVLSNFGSDYQRED